MLKEDIFDANVGWFLKPPTSTRDEVEDFGVCIGCFVITGEEAHAGACVDIAGNLGYGYGFGTESLNAGIHQD